MLICARVRWCLNESRRRKCRPPLTRNRLLQERSSYALRQVLFYRTYAFAGGNDRTRVIRPPFSSSALTTKTRSNCSFCLAKLPSKPAIGFELEEPGPPSVPGTP